VAGLSCRLRWFIETDDAPTWPVDKLTFSGHFPLTFMDTLIILFGICACCKDIFYAIFLPITTGQVLRLENADILGTSTILHAFFYYASIVWVCSCVLCSVLCYRTQWTAGGSVFGAVSLFFFVCVWNISGTAERHKEDVFGPSLGRVWRSKSKVKGQKSTSPEIKKRHFSALSGACVRFMVGKTSLASSLFSTFVIVFTAFAGDD